MAEATDHSSADMPTKPAASRNMLAGSVNPSVSTILASSLISSLAVSLSMFLLVQHSDSDAWDEAHC
jgi:hypothetical protein